jgi:proteasome lid subunit RPN8/RPN11
MTFPFPARAIAMMKQHALEVWPNESCGFVSNGEYIPMENKAVNKQDEFEFDWPLDRPIDAIVHSHPRDTARPTASDMQSQIDTAVPWAIVACDGKRSQDPIWWGDQLEPQPLIGRKFVHGVTDCYSLIRDYFRVERGIIIKEYPRDWMWWKNGLDLYRNGFREAGFKQITLEEVVPGDCFLAQVMSDVPNHAGVILPGWESLHHFQGRLSRRDPIARWRNRVTHWLRYEGPLETNLPARQTEGKVRAVL